MSSAPVPWPRAFRDSPEVGPPPGARCSAPAAGSATSSWPTPISSSGCPTRTGCGRARWAELVASALGDHRLAGRRRATASGRCSAGSSATSSGSRPGTCSATRRSTSWAPICQRWPRRSLEAALRALDPQVPFAVVALRSPRRGASSATPATSTSPSCTRGHGPRRWPRRSGSPAGLLRFLGGGTPAERDLDDRRRPAPGGSQRAAGPEPRRLAGLPRPVGLDLGAPGLPPGPARGGRRRPGRRLMDRDPATRSGQRPVHRGRRPRGAPHEGAHRAGADRRRDDDPEFHLKLGRGSLSDIEFTVQLLQLRHRHRRAPARSARCEALVEAGPPAGRRGRGARGGLPVLRANPQPLLPRGRGRATRCRSAQSRLTPLARSLGFTVAELRAEYRRVTRRARRVVEHRFYDRGDPVGDRARGWRHGRRGRREGSARADQPTGRRHCSTRLPRLGGPAIDELRPPEARAMYSALAAAQDREEVERVDDRLIPGPDGRRPGARVHPARRRRASPMACWCGSTAAAG